MAESSLIVFGGTFDPPHRAHLAAAEAVFRRKKPDRLLLVPAYQPIQAGGAEKQLTTPFEARVHMVSLAFAADIAAGRMAVSRVEESIAPPNYSLKTLQRIQAENPGARLGFIMGQDQWADFHRWHGPRDILALADIYCMTRPGFAEPRWEVERVLGLLGLTYVWAGDNTVSLATGRQVTWYPDVLMDVSSTALRTALRAGDRASAAAQLAPDVLTYIERVGLYRP